MVTEVTNGLKINAKVKRGFMTTDIEERLSSIDGVWSFDWQDAGRRTLTIAAEDDVKKDYLPIIMNTGLFESASYDDCN
jgi:hypothetical protein